MCNFKSGFVAIIGEPNVGKSTLVNQIIKEKLTIVSPKAQTTRNKIQAIYTTDHEQIVFIDTPGIHSSMHELGSFMNKQAISSLDGIDLIIFIVSALKKPNEKDRAIGELFKKQKVPVIIVFNKVDLVKDTMSLEETINQYKQIYSFSGGITLSAKNDFNTDKLLEMICDRLPAGPKYYPDDQFVDQSMRFMVQEIIREKVLLTTEAEVPHSVACVVEKYHETQNLIEINATIIVERPSQKSIIIGKNGSKIKEIGSMARKDIVNLAQKKIYLELFVKVEENWRNKKLNLKEYGYVE